MLESADLSNAELRRIVAAEDGGLDVRYSDIRFEPSGTVAGNVVCKVETL